MNEEKFRNYIKKSITYAENIFLIIVLITTIIAALSDVYNIIVTKEVLLADILLMFLYTEVVSMVGIFFSNRKVPLVYPVIIAITALSRLVVLQSKDMEPKQVLYEAFAIGVLSLAVIILRFSNKLKHDDND